MRCDNNRLVINGEKQMKISKKHVVFTVMVIAILACGYMIAL